MGWGLHPRAGELKQRRDSRIRGKPFSNGEINWDRREAFKAVRRGWSGQFVTDGTEWDIHRWSVPWRYVPWTGTCVHRCASGLGAGVWGLENRPRARTAVGCRQTDWGNRKEEMHSRECLQRRTRLPWEQGATAESHARGGATIVASLPPHAGACLQTIKEALSGLALARWLPSN